mmetsp:Transcript_62788/g.168464  ORF Transcript_62788/g.168464 Transcript_62788/m.168464 type:complete len:245 (+) Transcript_62788:270-1004(+)
MNKPVGGGRQVDEGVLLVGDPEDVLGEPALIGLDKSRVTRPRHPEIKARLNPERPRVVPLPVLHLQRHQRPHRRPQAVPRDRHPALRGLGGIGVAPDLLQRCEELGLQSVVCEVRDTMNLTARAVVLPPEGDHLRHRLEHRHTSTSVEQIRDGEHAPVLHLPHEGTQGRVVVPELHGGGDDVVDVDIEYLDVGHPARDPVTRRPTIPRLQSLRLAVRSGGCERMLHGQVHRHVGAALPVRGHAD